MRYAYDIQVNKERCEYSLGYEGKWTEDSDEK